MTVISKRFARRDHQPRDGRPNIAHETAIELESDTVASSGSRAAALGEPELSVRIHALQSSTALQSLPDLRSSARKSWQRMIGGNVSANLALRTGYAFER
jgi:hypothetical protein